MQELYTLDIFIPTYNRGALVKTCIEAAVSHCKDNDCHITVVDNNSKRDVPELRSSPKSGVKYICNYANFTANVNFLRCASLQTGKYFLLLGDDDLLLPAFNSIPKLLKRSSCRLAVFDGSLSNNEYVMDFKEYLIRKLWDPCEFGNLWHITSFIYTRGSFNLLGGLKHLNSMYPHAWATMTNILYDKGNNPYDLLVLPGSKYINVSGVSMKGTGSRPSFDSSEDYTSHTLEKTFQCSLFTLWATAFITLIDSSLTFDRLKHFYCKGVDKKIPGSYEYLIGLVENNTDLY